MRVAPQMPPQIPRPGAATEKEVELALPNISQFRHMCHVQYCAATYATESHCVASCQKIPNPPVTFKHLLGFKCVYFWQFSNVPKLTISNSKSKILHAPNTGGLSERKCYFKFTPVMKNCKYLRVYT